MDRRKREKRFSSRARRIWKLLNRRRKSPSRTNDRLETQSRPGNRGGFWHWDGGGGSAGGTWYWPPSLGGSGWVTINVHPFNPNSHGSGGYNNSGSTGSAGVNGTYTQSSDGSGTKNSTAGSGGGGAPGGNAGTAQPNGGNGSPGTPGIGGGGNIRIWKDQGVTSGTLNVNPDWSMTFITSSNGTSSGGRVVITNLDTNGSVNLSGDMPVEDLKSI